MPSYAKVKVCLVKNLSWILVKRYRQESSVQTEVVEKTQLALASNLPQLVTLNRFVLWLAHKLENGIRDNISVKTNILIKKTTLK